MPCCFGTCSLRRAARPLNRQAVRAANAAVAAQTGGRPLTMDVQDARLRRQWMDAYEAELSRQAAENEEAIAPDADDTSPGMVDDTAGEENDPDVVCADCPEEEPPICKVEILANPLGTIPGVGTYYHLHLKVTRADGSVVGMRGGPSGNGPGGSSGSSSELTGGSSNNSSGSNSSASDDTGPYGTIVTEISPYDAAFIDYPEPGQTLHSRVVAEGPDVCGKLGDLEAQINAIETTNTRYNPLGPNSNTTVTTALGNAGFSADLPDGVWAPGSDQRIETSGVD